jgi:biotin transporter BioY
MGYIIYFIGYIIATNIIVFVMDDDWKTEGVTFREWLACSIFGTLSWGLIIGFVLIYFIGTLVLCIHSMKILDIYMIKPNKK